MDNEAVVDRDDANFEEQEHNDEYEDDDAALNGYDDGEVYHWVEINLPDDGSLKGVGDKKNLWVRQML